MRRMVLLFLIAPALLLTQVNCGTTVKTARDSGISGIGPTNTQAGAMTATEMLLKGSGVTNSSSTNVQAGAMTATGVTARAQESPRPGQAWTNSLGMEFVPVPGTEVLFCKWETRVRDFEAFVKDTGYDATKGVYSLKKGNWGQLDNTWKNPGFAQDGTHPVVGVNWNDAKAFCIWLTEKERKVGRLKFGQEYRLPEDWEWSGAVGLDEDKNGAPKDKDDKIKDVYPWGRNWPPPNDAGNYAGSEAKDADWTLTATNGFRDNHPRTAPVGSYRTNDLGICDLGGNVWEWCEDKLAGGRVLRGGSWHDNFAGDLLSSHRNHFESGVRFVDYGFRVVVVVPAEAIVPDYDPTNTQACGRVAEEAASDPKDGPQPRLVATNGLGMGFVSVPGSDGASNPKESLRPDLVVTNGLGVGPGSVPHKKASSKLKECPQPRLAGTNSLGMELGSVPKEGPPPRLQWTNSLGMGFVSVPRTEVLFCKWETRVKDFEQFVTETGYDATNEVYSLRDGIWGQYGDSWTNPGFAQSETNPVVGVSWYDAQAFCKWLTGKERKAGLLRASQEYRLPRDWEWSVAVGLNEDKNGTPKDKDGKVKDVYPWGREWPPPSDAGNYAGSEAKGADWTWTPIEGFCDEYPRTAPVGSFKANKFRIYDLGGNVWEWCMDFYKGSTGDRVLRGGSWDNSGTRSLLSSRHIGYSPDLRLVSIGFRVVVAQSVR